VATEKPYEFLTAGDIKKLAEEIKKACKPLPLSGNVTVYGPVGPIGQESENVDDTKPVKPGSPEWQARVDRMLDEEATQPLGWWYLSYADKDGFRGGVIVETRGFTSAAMVSNVFGLSPGGEVRGMPIPTDKVPEAHYRYRLLTKAQLEEIWDDMATLAELEGEDS